MQRKKIGKIAFQAGQWPLDPDKPTLVFIHGSGNSCALWHHQIDSLSPIVNTVALDLPGHGDSDGPGLASVAQLAEVVFAFMMEVDCPAPIPCGLSLGGAIVQQLLLEKGAGFKAGILVSTGAKLRVMPEIFEAIEGDPAGFMTMYRQHAFGPDADDEIVAPVLEVAYRCDPAVVIGDFSACNRFDVMARLREIQVRVLILSGDKDFLTPPKYAAYLEAHIPRTTWVRIPEAGHLVPVEHPQAVNTAITAFLHDLSMAKTEESV